VHGVSDAIVPLDDTFIRKYWKSGFPQISGWVGSHQTASDTKIGVMARRSSSIAVREMIDLNHATRQVEKDQASQRATGRRWKNESGGHLHMLLPALSR